MRVCGLRISNAHFRAEECTTVLAGACRIHGPGSAGLPLRARPGELLDGFGVASRTEERPPTCELRGCAERIDAGELLACEPRPGSDEGPRFGNYGAYVAGISRQAARLVRYKLLLRSDAQRMKEEAAQSRVGRPGTCDD